MENKTSITIEEANELIPLEDAAEFHGMTKKALDYHITQKRFVQIHMVGNQKMVKRSESEAWEKEDKRHENQGRGKKKFSL